MIDSKMLSIYNENCNGTIEKQTESHNYYCSYEEEYFVMSNIQTSSVTLI